MARMTLEQIKASRPRVDRAKIEATSEEDIARHMREDGEDPDAGLGIFIEDVPPSRIAISTNSWKGVSSCVIKAAAGAPATR